MNYYMITRIGSNEKTSVKAKTKSDAIVKYIDKYWSSWFGPHIINDTFEIYSQDGTRIKFTVTGDQRSTR